MEDIEHKKHIEKVYSDKAMNLLKACIIILVLSGLSYLHAIIFYSSFDFGLIFEMLSFVFVITAYNKIEKHDLSAGKRNTIIAMIPIGWLLIYDLFNLIVNIEEVIVEVFNYYTSFDQFFYYLSPYLYDVTLVATLILLCIAYSSLSKADGTKKEKDYVSNFYDKL